MEEKRNSVIIDVLRSAKKLNESEPSLLLEGPVLYKLENISEQIPSELVSFFNESLLEFKATEESMRISLLEYEKKDAENEFVKSEMAKLNSELTKTLDQTKAKLNIQIARDFFKDIVVFGFRSALGAIMIILAVSLYIWTMHEDNESATSIVNIAVGNFFGIVGTVMAMKFLGDKKEPAGK